MGTVMNIIEAYIAGCNKEELENISMHIIKRQDVLRNTRELRLQELRQQSGRMSQ